MNQWGSANRILKIVNDELSIPTSTTLVAKTTLSAINSNLVGLYHLTCSGYCSRYEWAKKYFSILSSKEFVGSNYFYAPNYLLKNITDILVYPCSSKEIISMTPRPLFSAMDNTKLCSALQIELPYWDTELKNYLEENLLAESKKQPFKKRLREDVGLTYME